MPEQKLPWRNSEGKLVNSEAAVQRLTDRTNRGGATVQPYMWHSNVKHPFFSIAYIAPTIFLLARRPSISSSAKSTKNSHSVAATQALGLSSYSFSFYFVYRSSPLRQAGAYAGHVAAAEAAPRAALGQGQGGGGHCAAGGSPVGCSRLHPNLRRWVGG